MHHLLFGASLPLLIAVIIYVIRGRASMRFLILTPLLTAACAVWAVIPDIPRLIGLHGLYRRLDASPWTNIFFFHYLIDRAEDTFLDPIIYRLNPLWNSLFVFLMLLLLGIAWRELKKAEEG